MFVPVFKYNILVEKHCYNLNIILMQKYDLLVLRQK